MGEHAELAPQARRAWELAVVFGVPGEAFAHADEEAEALRRWAGEVARGIHGRIPRFVAWERTLDALNEMLSHVREVFLTPFWDPPKRLAQALERANVGIRRLSPPAQPRVEGYLCANEREEAAFVAQWAAERRREGKRVALLAADEETYARLEAALRRPPIGLLPRTRAGSALGEHPWARAAMLVLAARIHGERLLPSVLAPWVWARASDAPKALEKLTERPSWDPEDWERWLAAFVPKAFEEWRGMPASGRHPPSWWAARWYRALEAFGLILRDDRGWETEAVVVSNQLREGLIQLAQLDDVFPQLDAKKALGELVRIWQGMRLPAADGEVHLGLVEEGLLMPVDALAIAGADEAHLPWGARPQPFLPLAAQRDAG
ncbi:MAG: hypothetical protein D6771_00260, partial [Zetaproteobacteria bacterium]